ncbi:MAG: CBS domain-containing protein [Solobacterium sp.]|nr:CBS domain-containing protein [Solobacterium sp.]
MDKDNAERFLAAHARIEKKMMEMCGATKYIPFATALSQCARDDLTISHYQEDLREFNELRNSIVHLRDRAEEIIAVPTDRAVADIEKIADLVESEARVLKYASQPVITVRMDNTVEEAWKLMEQMETSKLPVYGDKGYIGLLTTESIARWALTTDQSRRKVADVLTTGKKNKVAFVGKKCSRKTVLSAFQDSLSHGAPIVAVIITETGSRSQKPVGIITGADLPRITADFL